LVDEHQLWDVFFPNEYGKCIIWDEVMMRIFLLVSFLAFTNVNHLAYSAIKSTAAITQAIVTSQLTDYSADPKEVKSLIDRALVLAKMNLTYLYGSSDPKNNQMKCTIGLQKMGKFMKYPQLTSIHLNSRI
jgi:hypothetical protein